MDLHKYLVTRAMERLAAGEEDEEEGGDGMAEAAAPTDDGRHGTCAAQQGGDAGRSGGEIGTVAALSQAQQGSLQSPRPAVFGTRLKVGKICAWMRKHVSSQVVLHEPCR